MEKTIKYWLTRLPEPHKTQALENAKGNLTQKKESQHEALWGGFVWASTPEGHEYWSYLANRIRNENLHKNPQ